jgi:PKD repeat protein
MRRNALLLLGAMVCAALMAGPASAQVQPAGTGEPLYTNSAQNTQWFEWPAHSGIDSYRVRFDYYENNALVANPTQSPAPNGATNVWANWSGVRTLQHGGQYGICAQGQYTFPNDSLWISDGPNSCSMGTTLGRRAYTTIDRSKPTAALQLAGGAAFVNRTNLALKVDFADDVAGPFPANFLCFQVGGENGVCNTSGGAIYGYNASCSVPGSAGKATTFNCTANYGEIVDGDVWACVIAADASIPDNPNGPNQSATADKANLSNPSCESVIVDRTPPVAAINASATSVKVGQVVSFQASASDATSGLTGPGEWTFGDSDAIPSGDAVTHVYDQPGTYEVTLTVRDKAGNAVTVRKTIIVSATTPPPGDDDQDDDPTDPGEAHRLRVDAPSRARARAEFIPVQLTATDRGKVQLQLLDGQTVLAKATVRLDPDGTADHHLKLKKGTAPGRYVLKAAWTPPRSATITKLRNIRLIKSPPVRRASASSSPGAVVATGPRALPDGAFHGTLPARTFNVG